MEFGLIFHWGLYSVTAYDNPVSARRRRTQNGSEWYLKRLLEKGTFRPISGWKETQEYHQKEFENIPYSDLTQFFDHNKKWNPNSWMELAKEVGATYVILTAKHHEGFCLWPTKTTDYHAEKDYVSLFGEAARAHGLKFGIYYSWSEFERRCTKEYLDTIALPQVKELATYHPDIWWFDGHWEITTKYGREKVIQLVESLEGEVNEGVALQHPVNFVEINDRLYKDPVWERPNFLGKATFRVYGDRHIPEEKPEVPWEHINTIGLSWGRNLAQEDYKTGEELFELYEMVREKGGKFLLNLGPDHDGNLDPKEVAALREFAELKK